MVDSARVVLTDISEGVGTLTLHRPQRHNAVDDDMAAELRATMSDLIADDVVRVIVVRGDGPSFCSGRDTSQLGRRREGESDFAFVRRAQDARLAMIDAPKPVIAAVHGHVIGGGMELALAADIRIAATSARFSLPEIRHGLLPDTGGTQVLTTLVGPGRAKIMVMTGRAVDAPTALAWGLVDQLVEPAELDRVVDELAHALAQSDPVTLAMAKQLVNQSWVEDARSGMRQELLAQTAIFAARRSSASPAD